MNVQRAAKAYYSDGIEPPCKRRHDYGHEPFHYLRGRIAALAGLLLTGCNTATPLASTPTDTNTSRNNPTADSYIEDGQTIEESDVGAAQDTAPRPLKQTLQSQRIPPSSLRM